MTKSLKPIHLFFELNITNCWLAVLTVRLYLQMVQRTVRQLGLFVLLCLIHINVDYLTMRLPNNAFLLKGENLLQCIPCLEPFTVKHFRLDCTNFRITRSRFVRVNGVKGRFDTVEPASIFSFLKEMGIYTKV